MKKECTCKKLIKDDKITLIHECDRCYKKKVKCLKLGIELAKLMLGIDNKNKARIPDYAKGSKIKPEMVPDSNNDVYTHDCIKNMFNNYNQNKPDFHKQMLEADKELQRVFSNVKTQTKEVYQEWTEDENEKTGWSGSGWIFKDDDEFMEENKWTIIEHLDSDKYYNPILAIAQRD
jgi:hypothetical protein